jgi:hypothetical protein
LYLIYDQQSDECSGILVESISDAVAALKLLYKKLGFEVSDYAVTSLTPFVKVVTYHVEDSVVRGHPWILKHPLTLESLTDGVL